MTEHLFFHARQARPDGQPHVLLFTLALSRLTSVRDRLMTEYTSRESEAIKRTPTRVVAYLSPSSMIGPGSWANNLLDGSASAKRLPRRMQRFGITRF